jgi:hypothetical protein
MKLSFEEYTADAICRAMNLPGFIEPAWREREHPTLRIVLKPSFHPEVCLTISRDDRSALISVIALAESFWTQGSSVEIKSSREEFPISTETFGGWLKLFGGTFVPVAGSEKVAYADGMSLECGLVSRHVDQQFKSHVSQLPDQSFLGGILDMAWISCKDPAVRDGLSDAASYLGLNFPRQGVPPVPPSSRIAVLGDPEARKEYFEILQRAKEKRAKKIPD